MATKRPAGVTIAAVAAILGSGLFVLLGLGMLWSALLPVAQPNAPPFLKVVSFVMSVVMLGFAGWSITTAVGLFRLRGWSRWSILIFSALLAFMGGASALMISILPMPPTPQVSQETMTGIKSGIAVFYGALALMGGFWLFYFNTARVKIQFGPGGAVDGPGGRPLSISVVAWFALVGGALCIAGAFSPFPGTVLGIVVTGWAARAFYVVFAAFEIWLGIGLLRLNPLSRVAAIAMFGFAILNSVLFVVLPGYPERLRVTLESMPYALRQPAGYDALSSIGLSMIFGTLVSAIPIWFLISNRNAFTKHPQDAELQS